MPFQIRSKVESDLRQRYDDYCHGLVDCSLLAYPNSEALKQIGVPQDLL